MTKKGLSEFWRPKCGKRLKICGYRKLFSKKRVIFFQMACGRPEGGRGSGSCGQGEEGQKPDFRVDVINGWPQSGMDRNKSDIGVANRLDYCSSLYAGLPACRPGCLDRVLRSAARLIGGIPKFGHVSKYMLDVLNWLPAEQWISYRIASLVWCCLLGLAPLYLRELCCPLLSAMSSRSLGSSQQGLLLVPFARTSAKQSRVFFRGGSLDLEWAPFSTSDFP